MQPLLLGDHPALDFLNTVFMPDGKPVETIVDGQAYLAWFTAAGLLPAGEADDLRRRFGAADLDRAADEARRVRAWARDRLACWRDRPGEALAEDWTVLNDLLARVTYARRLVIAGPEAQLVETAVVATPDALIGLVAREIADLVSAENADLVRTCAGASCTLWFLDRTKAHRRLFCSAATCGNRAKVAAFRKRRQS